MDRAKQDNQDIYVQQIGRGAPLRITSDPGIEYNPVWSPDGRWIAYLQRRWESGVSELRLVAPLGGTDYKLADIRTSNTYYINPPYLAWCPDSRCLVASDSPVAGKPAALFLIALDTGERRQLTNPEFPALGDTTPAVSPDGKWLVFRRQRAIENAELTAKHENLSPAAPSSAGVP